MELPSLKVLNSVPALYVMALGYVLLLGSVSYLTLKRSESMDKSQAEVVRLLQNCMDDARKARITSHFST